MPDFNPNEMDALFREGAERHEFEYNPDAWSLMEEKLDRKERKRRWLFLLIGILFLVAAVGIFTQLDSDQSTNLTDSGVIASSSTDTDPIQEENVSKKLITSNSEEEISENTIEENKENTKEYISTDSKERSSNIGAQISFQSENTGNLVGNEIVSMPSPAEQDVIIDNEVEEQITDVKVAQNQFIENTYTEKIVPANPHLSFSKISNTRISLLDRTPIDFGAFDLEAKPSEVEVIIPDFTKNRFAVTLFANPEWSSVGLLQDAKAGWSMGARFGYQFSNNFEISAGLAYSRKVYKGTGVEYNMDGGWFQDIEPMSMDAECDVIEIPIGLSYYVNGFRNSGFFADLGINSYMLHSEWYGFEYDDALVRPTRYVDVVEEDQNKHLIGVGRFALGYQKVLSNKSAVQFAPYLQFPLTGIGAGQVNVYSAGVQIAVKFNTQ